MHLKIEHYTTYQYSKKVFVEPHHLYFYPSYRPNIEILDFQIDVKPTPSGLGVRLDEENNSYFQCWFDEELQSLTIESVIEVVSHAFNPFNFLIEKTSQHNKILACYGQVSTLLEGKVKEWLNQLIADVGKDPLTFITALCKEINKGWEHTTRYEPDLLSVNQCFMSKAASCRDLAWMMIEMVKTFGLPARFVSGYSFNPEISGHELHAWVEVWIQGAGWIGLDPSSGLLTTENYIPLTASFLPSNTLPVQGSIRGSASSDLTTKVNISQLK